MYNFFFEKLLIKQMITIPVPTISQHPVSTVQKYATGACIVLLSYWRSKSTRGLLKKYLKIQWFH